MTGRVQVRRAQEAPRASDGARVLVDRVWPRGLRKDAARLDDWAKDVAPTAQLRTWYGHDPAKWAEFGQRYRAELAGADQRAALGRLRALTAAGPVTLLTATRDVTISQAQVLADLLTDAARQERARERELEREAGDPACFAHLVCPECGAVVSEGHRPGCAQA